LTASGTAPPAANTTGGANFSGYVHGSNTAQVAADFTSAVNTSLQTITGLSWNLDANAKKYSFHCSLMYSQATAAVAMQFGIQAATVSRPISPQRLEWTLRLPLTLQEFYRISRRRRQTAIVTFTPSAITTVFAGDLDGTIDLPANNGGNVVNIMVQTSNSADLRL
jgi:hypothetical protein